ncbi:MAG: hypothetical protein ACPL3Q_09140 [Candidatus Ratteibacteria bacterium]
MAEKDLESRIRKFLKIPEMIDVPYCRVLRPQMIKKSTEDEILEKRKFLPDYPEYFVDVRGLDESMPEEKKSFFRPYGYDFMMDMCHTMFGEIYPGKRIFDVLSTIELLKNKSCKIINLYGNRQAALIGLFVAFLSNAVEAFYLKNLPESFSAPCKTVSTQLPSVNFPKGY